MSVQRTAESRPGDPLDALDRALALVVISASDGTIRRANANFLGLSGHKARGLVGQPISILDPEASADVFGPSSVWEAVRRGTLREFETRWRRQDGSRLALRLQCAPILDRDGVVHELLVAATDITRMLQANADARSRVAAAQAHQSVLRLAPDGTILDANACFLDATGHSRDTLIGRHHRGLLDATDAEGTPEPAAPAAFLVAAHWTGRLRCTGPHGGEVWLQACCDRLVGDDEDEGSGTGPASVVVQGVDITAEALHRADQAAQIHATHASHGVITFDLDSTVLDANRNFLEAVGYRLEEVEGRHHRMFVEPSFAHGAEYANFWAELVEGRHQSGEYRRIGKHGREVWLQASYNPIRDLRGKPCKVVKYATVITREKLRRADHQGQIASIHKAQCVASFGLDGTILDANDNFLDATGYRLSELRGQPHRMFVDEATAASAEYRSFWSELAQGRHHAAEFKRLRKDGREIWWQASYNPILDMNGRPFKVVKYATDVTLERLRQADDAGQIAAIRKSYCVATFDLDGRLLEANDKLVAALGQPQAALEGRHHRSFVDPEHAASEDHRVFWERLRAGNFQSVKDRWLGPRGREVWLEASYNPILDLNGRPFKVMMIATDVSAEVALAADVAIARRQAREDVATALPNRAGLAQFMSDALAHRSRRLVVLYLDLDHFKPINDTFGHPVGDLVLQETARRLQRAVGPDRIVARVGGDEFVVAAPAMPDEQIEPLCQHLIELVQTPIRHGSGVLTVGLSIGIAVSPEDATTADDLLRCADVALYRTKGNGRGSYSFFATDMHERLSANRHLAEEMRYGIKSGQFFLDYRARLEPSTGALVGVEALVRWLHPVRGRLEPGEFIALAERSGLILPLGEWILETACRTAAAWPGVGLVVAVSPVLVAGTDVPPVVRAVLARTGLPPERLVLEMSERVLVDDAGRTRGCLEALKQLGVGLTIADHGDEHRPLSVWRALSFDHAAIDARFIADLQGETDGDRIVRDLNRAATLAAPGEAVLLLGLDAAAPVTACRLGPILAADAVADWSTRGQRPVTPEGDARAGAAPAASSSSSPAHAPTPAPAPTPTPAAAPAPSLAPAPAASRRRPGARAHGPEAGSAVRRTARADGR